VPVVVQYTTAVGPDEYDEVVSAMRFHDELPDGLIVHTAAITREGEMRVFDVWQSREAHDRFVKSRLRPAIHEVTGEDRPDAPPAPEVHQLHSLVKPIRR
jgi:heme-degrading monooxygenase HmoA